MTDDLIKILLASIVSGAIGMLLFMFHELKRDVRDVAHEVTALASRVLKGETILEFVSRRKDTKQTRREGDKFL